MGTTIACRGIRIIKIARPIIAPFPRKLYFANKKPASADTMVAKTDWMEEIAMDCRKLELKSKNLPPKALNKRPHQNL